MTDQDKIFLYQNLGCNIKRVRESKGINQDSFAKLLDLTRVSIINIEKGRQRVSIHLLYDIAKITDTPIQDFLPQLTNISNLEEKWVSKIADQSQGNTLKQQYLTDFLKTIKPKD